MLYTVCLLGVTKNSGTWYNHLLSDGHNSSLLSGCRVESAESLPLISKL
jgi:hypothetical protein